jgi:hypothetical protein
MRANITLTEFNIGKFIKGLLNNDETHSHLHVHTEYDEKQQQLLFVKRIVPWQLTSIY